MWVDHFFVTEKNIFKTFYFLWEMFSPCTRSRRLQCSASTGCFQSSLLQSPLWRENQDTFFYSHFWTKPFICVYLLQTCHQIQLEKRYFDKFLEWISHVFHKSCPSGSRHRPHLAKVQRSRSQEQIGPRWQKVQKEPTTSWSMQWDTNSNPEMTDWLMLD